MSDTGSANYMQTIGGAQVVVYDAAPDMDDSVPSLAMAVDAAIDAIGDALAEGDMAQATALQVAADTTSDALLEALGVPDADDMDDDS